MATNKKIDFKPSHGLWDTITAVFLVVVAFSMAYVSIVNSNLSLFVFTLIFTAYLLFQIYHTYYTLTDSLIIFRLGNIKIGVPINNIKNLKIMNGNITKTFSEACNDNYWYTIPLGCFMVIPGCRTIFVAVHYKNKPILIELKTPVKFLGIMDIHKIVINVDEPKEFVSEVLDLQSNKQINKI
ncbi:MAG: hypothetical protein CVT89_01625 [Candidatus Altiarchaeales archaeon HGW-Altiarchaeales-2]|nr:MAG: hypothetical protein CVT89_01625 [Candidatus Altiarchaeales archaeon HGW-Altiarchaeales-2]